MPRAAAAAIADRSAVSPAPDASISSSTALIDGWSPNQSFSSSGPVTPATPSSPSAALFSQPLWASPLVRITGTSPVAASSSTTVPIRSHAPDR